MNWLNILLCHVNKPQFCIAWKHEKEMDEFEKVAYIPPLYFLNENTF